MTDFKEAAKPEHDILYRYTILPYPDRTLEESLYNG